MGFTSVDEGFGLLLPDEPSLPLPEDQAVLVFQSVRELLMNSAKHSHSSQANVILQYRQEALRIEVNMPKMSGIDATSMIKTRHPEMVVIGLSVNASPQNDQAMRGAGAALLLTKEAAVEQLQVCIHEAMQGRRP